MNAEVERTRALTTDRLTDRRLLLSAFDPMRRDLDATGTTAGMDRIDPRRSFAGHSGRPLPILADGSPIAELV